MRLFGLIFGGCDCFFVLDQPGDEKVRCSGDGQRDQRRLEIDEISGNIIVMQEEKHVELISPFLQHDRTWIRNVAKKYIQRFK